MSQCVYLISFQNQKLSQFNKRQSRIFVGKVDAIGQKVGFDVVLRNLNFMNTKTPQISSGKDFQITTLFILAAQENQKLTTCCGSMTEKYDHFVPTAFESSN